MHVHVHDELDDRRIREYHERTQREISQKYRNNPWLFGEIFFGLLFLLTLILGQFLPNTMILFQLWLVSIVGFIYSMLKAQDYVNSVLTNPIR